MKSEDVPRQVVMKAMWAAYLKDPYRYPAPVNVEADAGMASAIGAVWEDICEKKEEET